MNRLLRWPGALLPTLLLAGCAAAPVLPVAEEPAPAAEDATLPVAPVDAFIARLRQHCGQAFAGRIVADEPAPTGADPFVGKPLVMHIRECRDSSLHIPFHVGDDRSRTWVLTRTVVGLRLKHDHRHADGTPDALTRYGGDSLGRGSSLRQVFPADHESRTMFAAEGRVEAQANVWAMEIVPGQRFAYELTRPGRRFRVEFDLTQPVPAPPAPWGAK